MQNKKDERPVTVYLDKEMVKKLKQLAIEKDTTFKAVLQEIIKEYLG